MSKKQHLLKVWKQTGRKPKELDEVLPPPTDLIYLWDWLGNFTYPLSFTELEAWTRLTGRSLARWQIQAMAELDKVRAHG